ncbi:hypothetical protein PAPYR_10112 [Paratrimastix pyriformis]|uniref:Uncharacterized protein n=1 Tax=Paratrimastix pyriformis TaxID=342808 RepID=A0ABQ8U6R2_9EUKA|nr:hypothetical protein PAPYR_10112 [Paratrimastix pyriformis]
MLLRGGWGLLGTPESGGWGETSDPVEDLVGDREGTRDIELRELNCVRGDGERKREEEDGAAERGGRRSRAAGTDGVLLMWGSSLPLLDDREDGSRVRVVALRLIEEGGAHCGTGDGVPPVMDGAFPEPGGSGCGDGPG